MPIISWKEGMPLSINRTKWVIDNEIPRFKDEGRDYIEKLVFVGE
jgi:hypothetical protein